MSRLRGTTSRCVHRRLAEPDRDAAGKRKCQMVGMLVSFALGLILSTAHIAGSPAPFGLAFLAAMGYGSGGALCLVGCALGYFAAFGVATGTQLAAGCCLTFLTAYFLRSHPFVQTRWYPPAVSAAAYILTRLVLYLLTGRPVAAAGVQNGTVFAAVRCVGLWI